MSRNFWNVPNEGRTRPRKLLAEEMRGLFDIRTFRHMDIVLAAGLGGGSLIYANVFMEPPSHVFDQRWPESCRKSKLEQYFSVAKSVMGSRPIPNTDDPRREIIRTKAFEHFAKEVGRESELVDINVFFGNDFKRPLEIGHQEKNRYGALQTSCTYCAECDVGCNTHSKNTLDLNYLFVAENRYNATIRTEHQAEKIVPLNEQGDDDPEQYGSHGFKVYFRDLTDPTKLQVASCNRVVVSAGTLGSNELLLRCRDVHQSLPRISKRLGRSYSGNGDFLSFVTGADRACNPNYGPVITQRVDYNLFKDFDRSRAFILEDASYPAFGAWFAEGVKPGFLYLGSLGRVIKSLFGRYFSGRSLGSAGYAFRDMLGNDVSQNSAVLLCMGLDESDGTMSLDSAGCIQVNWPYRNSMPLYKGILESGRKFKQVFNAKLFFPLPTWHWPIRKNVSVHSMGGCVLSDSPEKGVTSADRESFGQVFGYKNLFVADGSIVPTSVGANPSMTITALSEMVAEGITGIIPDADL